MFEIWHEKVIMRIESTLVEFLLSKIVKRRLLLLMKWTEARVRRVQPPGDPSSKSVNDRVQKCFVADETQIDRKQLLRKTE